MALGEARGGLEGLKLDEIDAANSFLMLPMARNALSWPILNQLFPSKTITKRISNKRKTNRRHESA